MKQGLGNTHGFRMESSLFYVTLNKAFNFPKPQFPYLENGDNRSSSLIGMGVKIETMPVKHLHRSYL